MFSVSPAPRFAAAEALGPVLGEAGFGVHAVNAIAAVTAMARPLRQ